MNLSEGILAERENRIDLLPVPLEPVITIPFSEVGVDISGKRICFSFKALALALADEPEMDH